MKSKLFFSAMLASLLVFGLTLTACGPSKATLAIMNADSIDDVWGINNKLTWLKHNAQSGGNYTIELNSDETIWPPEQETLYEAINPELRGYLFYEGRSNITITIKGIDENRTISSGGTRVVGSITIFEVGSGVTLVLDDNITLKAGPIKNLGIVEVKSGGTFVMNDGSTITGNNRNEDYQEGGAGVYVDNGGTFIMKGGIISGNVCTPSILAMEEYKKSQAIQKAVANSIKGVQVRERETAQIGPVCKGGGVYIKEEGIFTKTGGTIAGYNGDLKNSNTVASLDGRIINGNGHAIYFEGLKVKGNKGIDTTIGPEENLQFKNGKLTEGTPSKSRKSKAPPPTSEEDEDEEE